MDAQRILGVDAAIVFADLLPILEPMGLELEYVVGRRRYSPTHSQRSRCGEFVAAPAIEHTPYIADTVRCINEGLPNDIALIGLREPLYLGFLCHRGKGFA